jgi:tRNA 2-thiouridine synthesizing protein E
MPEPYPVDALGYLSDPARWDRDFAESRAAADGITLSAAHWQILELLRAHYAAYGSAPPMRLLTRLVTQQLGAEFGNSRALYRLFPEGPAKMACKYAGLPKPVSCI